MSGRPVHLLAAAMIAAAASLASISAASAGCYNCGTSYAPVVTYQAPVVYSQSYASPCGCATAAPMYVVNQGPAYNAAVTLDAEPTPAYEGGYGRAYPYYSGGGMRWHRRHWHHRGHGYRHHGYRYGAVAPGYRHGWRPRHAMVGPGGFYRGGYRAHGPRFAHGPRVRLDLPIRAHRMHMGPGSVHPRMMSPGPRGPMHRPIR